MRSEKNKGLLRLWEYISKGLKMPYLLLKQPQVQLMLMNLNFRGFFVETGFFDSYVKKMPIDEKGNPIPWVSYSFIWFIQERLTKNMDIFEFGSGNSTHFYSKYVKTVNSVEHDKDWFDKINDQIPSNASLHFCELTEAGDYSKFSTSLDNKFDIIIVDGRDRVNCLINSIQSLNPEGVIVLDDAFRERYQSGRKYLLNSGFKSIKFWGPAPLSFRKKNTELFYRDLNCLEI